MNNFIRRAVLVVVGIAAALGSMEVFLWALGGRLPDTARVAPSDASRYRIVAVGESTTAAIYGPAWPEFLEQELNRRAGKPLFRVYNLGVSGTNTDLILSRLPRDIADLRPNMVISMMGVNDMKYFALPRRGTAQFVPRVYRFFAFLWQLATSRSKRGLAERALRCTQTEREGSATVSQAFMESHPLSYLAAEVFIRTLAEQADWRSVHAWAKTILANKPFVQLCIATSSPDEPTKARDLRHMEDVFTEIASLDAIAQRIVAGAVPGSDYVGQMRAALGIPAVDNNVDTRKNYRLFADTVANRRISYIAMQYPLQPASDLSELFKDRPDVTVVGNEENFQRALATRPYSDVFIDNFAFTFGHTTPLGSQLIASSAADAVMNVLR